MTTIVITLNSICAGGNHLTFGASVNGGAQSSVVVDADGVFTAMTNDEKAAFIKGVIKLYKIGRTVAATKTAFQSGVTVTL